ncbi:HK97 family phage prohead protease [Mesorhizobium sp. M1A.F.Ca.IN.020.06.1.1]|uniref:HK97 family phage prohead protease n=2 Tax=Mesorhizobium TaxID=68287 RepID=UPI000FD3D1BE|nr:MULTISPECIES: HK97 family phage prohead protease [unclassified Mesorhizobium]RUV89199.1 HK97 family phage prohead protease [Mesorhizobium sp. M1A.F.Ca.IN.020.32.1.1]RUW26681.1 HK97 family phage prohead protease [Mesorhizobium sp. M1A.F.Ca.IN.020.06.1.1]RWF81942.1 MAG: HK97 family phage prohead protease [Mesorhizobium sp.]RWG01356.1 MAG: HK97 family phage prohead protease [Mesorhizobium sp.]RWG76446.1 MAG: HK97 family phage prohead protease [Mesorhizobium sp.]
MADSNTISGYVARFGDITNVGGDFRERLAPGCFTRTLREMPDVVMILDHDSGRVLGRVSAGSLQLREDSVGLHFTLYPDPTTPEGQTAIGTVARQDVKGCSFSFSARSESWDDGAGDQLPLRTIEDLDLWECTLTAFPQYETTSAKLKRSSKQDNAANALRRIEEKGAKLSASARRAQMEMAIRGIR